MATVSPQKSSPVDRQGNYIINSHTYFHMYIIFTLSSCICHNDNNCDDFRVDLVSRPTAVWAWMHVLLEKITLAICGFGKVAVSPCALPRAKNGTILLPMDSESQKTLSQVNTFAARPLQSAQKVVAMGLWYKLSTSTLSTRHVLPPTAMHMTTKLGFTTVRTTSHSRWPSAHNLWAIRRYWTQRAV